MVNHTPRPADPSMRIGQECTIELPSGEFCAARVWPESRQSICRSHAVDIYMTLRGIHQDIVAGAGGELYLRDEQRDAELDAAAKTAQERSVVYYVRIGDAIKIGYSSNLKQRISSLRARRSDVLAVEPGARKLEAQRHLKFASLRRGKREDFEPSFALIQHIDAVRERHGDPVFS